MKLLVELPDEEYKIDKLVAESGMGNTAIQRILEGTPLPECKDCKFFEYDYVAPVDGIPLILGHELCKKWGDGCKTSEHGYCFLFEAKEGEK